MNFRSANPDGKEAESGEQDGPRESERAAKAGGEHLSRAEYVNFVRDLQEAMSEFEERLTRLEEGLAAYGDRAGALEEEVDTLREWHRDHAEQFVALFEYTSPDLHGKVWEGYEGPDGIEVDEDGEVTAETARSGASSGPSGETADGS